jgi:hypothetical protein
MRLFPKKATPPAGEATSRQHRQATNLACAIARRQQQVAVLLSKRFEELPLQARKTCFLGFCLLMGSACGWPLLQALRLPAGKQARTTGHAPTAALITPTHIQSFQAAPDSLATPDVYPFQLFK